MSAKRRRIEDVAGDRRQRMIEAVSQESGSSFRVTSMSHKRRGNRKRQNQPLRKRSFDSNAKCLESLSPLQFVKRALVL